MQVPSTQQAIERFDENDSFLYACLGLVALVPQFDTMLAGLVAKVENSPPGEHAGDPLLDVALGLIALRLQVGVQLSQLTRESVPIAPLHTDCAPGAARELLR